MYDYEKMKPKLFTDEGQRLFLKVRDHVFKLLDFSGAVDIHHIFKNFSGDSWTLWACVDRMIELEEIIELCPDRQRIRVYVRKGN